MIEKAIRTSLYIILVLSFLLGILLWEKLDREESIVESKSFNLVYSPVFPKEQNIVLGSWVEPKYENNEEFQGFTLYSDGTAQSINTELLDYKTWEIRGNKLSLWLDEDMETYEIEKVSPKALWLKVGESVFKYRRLTT